MKNKGNKICLIGGTGRCGSTLLKKILQSHPKVADTGTKEWRFLTDPDGLADFYATFKDNWHPQLWDVKVKRLSRLLKDLGKNNFVTSKIGTYFKKTGLWKKIPVKLIPRYAEINISKYCQHFNLLSKILIDNLTQFDYDARWFGSEHLRRQVMRFGAPYLMTEAFKTFYEAIVKLTLTDEEEFFVDDNAYSILWFDKILNFLPDAKLVHIYRDPRDVVCSLMNQSWAPSTMYEAIKYYEGIMRTWKKVRLKVPPDSFIEVKFEDIVRKIDTLWNMVDFLGIPSSPAVNNFKIDKSKTNIGKWKTEFNLSQQVALNNLLKYQIKDLNYESD